MSSKWRSQTKKSQRFQKHEKEKEIKDTSLEDIYSRRLTKFKILLLEQQAKAEQQESTKQVYLTDEKNNQIENNPESENESVASKDKDVLSKDKDELVQDELDKFMNEIQGISSEVIPFNVNISLEEIQKMRPIQNENDDQYHQEFKEVLCKSSTQNQQSPGHLEKQENNKDTLQENNEQIEEQVIIKQIYKPTKEQQSLTHQQVEQIRNSLHISIRGKDCPAPISDWWQIGLPESVLNNLKHKNFKKPFPIQRQAIPALLSGRDIIGIAETGSGKTLAYILPLVKHICSQAIQTEGGFTGLVLCPTRELTRQVSQETKK